ncbi:ATP-binding protein [Aerosakkonemataceae cyanobacterium BLCC-F154]|uniref:histidine kinase n=2 Tax=Floridanema TaxID=3396149 RepID=A0ABV4YEA4_9CYAN
MLMPASSEFVTLCQAQVDLLTQSLGAALSVVYVTEELVEEKETKLIPIVAYPEAGVIYSEKRSLSLLPNELQGMSGKRRLPSAVDDDEAILGEWARDEGKSSPNQGKDNFLLQQRQIVFPLIHDEVVMGLLVTSRGDRAWNEAERSQIEEIAETIAIACILDQRSQWLEQRFAEQQRLQAQQNDLLHNLLHQLRNPLTALRTFGKLLVKRLGLDDKNGEFANSILRESDRIQDLLQQFDRVIDLTDNLYQPSEEGILGDLLTISPVDSQVEIEKEKRVKQPLLLLPESGLMSVVSLSACSLVEVLDSVLAAAFAIAQERNLTFKADIPDNLPTIKCHTKALTEVLSNIVDNALKYTPSGGKIFVEIKRKDPPDGKFLGVAVSDNGPGIPQQDLEHLFTRGFRGVQAKTEIPGTGLGLAIAQELVQQMQGKIEVFSPAKHPEIKECGTTFIVWLQEFSK